MIHEIAQTIYLSTPKGLARAKFLLSNGDDADLEWICFHDDGSIWSWRNYDVKVASNVTMGVKHE